jgi:YegS/Rv2252/BmrU family lipid kinase
LKALFLINARSGSNRKRDISTLIRASCDWEGYELAPCERKEDLDTIIERALRDRFDVVFAVGGDGTVHEVAKRLIGTPLALAVIPTGSGNGFARHIGFPLDPRKTIAACRDARVAAIDTAEVNGRPFIGIMGLGFDAFVAHRFDEQPARGLRTYVGTGLRGLTKFRAEDYEITVDGKPVRERAIVVAIANTGQYGNNARIAPRASVLDGRLDVVILRRATLLAVPLLVSRLFAGTLDRSRAVETHVASEIVIRREAEGDAHLDGEPVILPRDLQIRVRPRSLHVLVPAGGRSI